MEDERARTVFVPPRRERSVVEAHLAEAGLRPTSQRSLVYEVLLGHAKEHPTADEIFIQAKQEKPDISMATVYNCLDALVRHNLIRQMHLDRAATRYCPNMHEHAHFLCEECGEVSDFEGQAKPRQSGFKVPREFKVTQVEMNMRGLCPDCTEKGVSR
ncbi:MAG: Fur family transcriptional regulator [Verrucomicrobiota bacterium]|jgi:Fur family peroxide stress response transcriptional regulator|nr:Fur family transcriptional regulator [Verrucomicrobiota bacterium]